MTTTDTLATPSGAGASGRAPAVLCAASATMAMLVLDSSVLGVMLPSIRRELALTDAAGTAVLIVYLVALALVLPLGGRLSDRIGALRVFVGGTAGFVISSAGIAFAHSAAELIAGRVAAGVAAGMLMPATMALLGAVYPGEQRTRALTVYSGVGQAFAVAGPAVGGLCAQFVGWQWGFLVNVPAGLTALALVAWARPHTPPQPRRPRDATRGRLWSTRLLAATGLLTALGFAMTVATVYGAVELQDSLRLSPAASGLALLPLVVPLLIATRWVARTGAALPARTLGLAGAAAMTGGAAVMALGFAFSTLWLTCLGMVPTGAGIALVMGPISSAAMSAAPTGRAGTAAAIATTGRQLGGAAGVASYAALAAAGSPALGFLVAAGVMGTGILLAAAL